MALDLERRWDQHLILQMIVILAMLSNLLKNLLIHSQLVIGDSSRGDGDSSSDEISIDGIFIQSNEPAIRLMEAHNNKVDRELSKLLILSWLIY